MLDKFKNRFRKGDGLVFTFRMMNNLDAGTTLKDFHKFSNHWRVRELVHLFPVVMVHVVCAGVRVGLEVGGGITKPQ